MASVPDRAYVDLSLLPDVAANGSPSFPFVAYHNNGYFAFDPALEYVGGVVPCELKMSGLKPRLLTSGPTSNEVIAWCLARGILVTATHLIHFASGFAAPGTSSVAFDPMPTYQEGRTYKLLFTCLDVDNLEVRLWNADEGGNPSIALLTVTGLFAGDPIFTTGALPDSIRAANTASHPGNISSSFTSPLALVIQAMGAEATGPTDITLSNATVLAAKESGYPVGNLQTTHPTDSEGFNYAFVAGTGDTNNASFTITGVRLTKYGTLTAGAKSIRVRTTDKFGKTYTKALTVTVV